MLTEEQIRILKDLRRSWKRARGGVPTECTLCDEFEDKDSYHCDDCHKKILRLFLQGSSSCLKIQFGGVTRFGLYRKSLKDQKIFSDALIKQIDELLEG